MTEQNLNNTTPENPEESSFNLYEIIFKYLVYWPWFVASVIICLVLAFVYLRYQAPVYNVTASVLIKEQDARSRAMSANSGALEALQSMGGFSMTNNFDNEVEILKSRTLIKKVVTHLGLYITTGEKRFFGYAQPLYQTSPIGVYMAPEEAEQLEAPLIEFLEETGTVVEFGPDNDSDSFQIRCQKFRDLPVKRAAASLVEGEFKIFSGPRIDSVRIARPAHIFPREFHVE